MEPLLGLVRLLNAAWIGARGLRLNSEVHIESVPSRMLGRMAGTWFIWHYLGSCLPAEGRLRTHELR